MHLTVKTKIVATKEQKNTLQETMHRFNETCNYISLYAHQHKIFNAYKLHRLLYQEVKARFGLGAQAIVRAFAKVADAYHSGKRQFRSRFRQFKPNSAVVFDKRNLTLQEIDKVSLWTTRGRMALSLLLGERNRNLLANYPRYGEVDLLCIRGSFYLSFVLDMPQSSPIQPVGFLGVDFGIVHLATTSEGKTYSGQDVDHKRTNTNKHRRALQKKGSKRAKYRLKQVSGKEQRFKTNTNHVIAKQVVARAQALGVGIAIEDLSGFRATVSHQQRERFGKWAFAQLRSFIEYKAKIAGVPVIAVNPRNTSRQCHRCGYTSKKNRPTQAKFCCQKCGLTKNADLNAAINIANRAIEQLSGQTASPLRAVVSQPNVVQLLLPFAAVRGTTSPSALALGR